MKDITLCFSKVRMLSALMLILSMYSSAAYAQTEKQLVNGREVETGYFSNNQPYVVSGRGNKVLLVIEELSFDHKPPEGFLLKLFVKQNEHFFNDYTVYRVGRKPNLPDGYLLDDMADDYAFVIQSEFKQELDILGTSTGGQIALRLASRHPDLIHKVVLISAAYKLSEEGLRIEEKAASYYAQKKYGKTMATLMEAVYDKGLKRFFYKGLMRMFARSFLKKVEYPNDFQIEVAADKETIGLKRLNQINAPALVITGKKDIGYSFVDVKTTSDNIPGAKLLSYEKFGHDLYGSNYKEVNIEILKFLAE